MEPDWAKVYAVLRRGRDITSAEAQEVVQVLALAMSWTADSEWPQELDSDDAWSTLRLVRPWHQALAQAWAAWVSENISEREAYGRLNRVPWREPFVYALRVLGKTGYQGNEAWQALEASARVRDQRLTLEAVVCARLLGAVGKGKAVAFLTMIGSSGRTPLPVKLEVWWSLVLLRSLRRGCVDDAAD